MPDVELPHPFDAYVGPQPYLFVSYAHADGAEVFSELTYLYQQGYRIWYDEGIDPGNEWPEEVAVALTNAAHFLVFISKAAVDSHNVRNEINFAINRRKPFLAVHLHDIQLPPGLELRMGDIQAILRYRMTDQAYHAKLARALPNVLKNEPSAKPLDSSVPRLDVKSGEYSASRPTSVGKSETYQGDIIFADGHAAKFNRIVSKLTGYEVPYSRNLRDMHENTLELPRIKFDIVARIDFCCMTEEEKALCKKTSVRKANIMFRDGSSFPEIFVDASLWKWESPIESGRIDSDRVSSVVFS